MSDTPTPEAMQAAEHLIFEEMHGNGEAYAVQIAAALDKFAAQRVADERKKFVQLLRDFPSLLGDTSKLQAIANEAARDVAKRSKP